MSNLSNNIYQMQHEEFLFLGREYSDEKLDFGKIFGDFFSGGGYEKIAPYQKDKDDHCVDTVVFYNKSTEYKTVFIGHMVEGITEAPEGHILEKLPAAEFIVVTSGWVPTEDESHIAANANKKQMQVPDGYVSDNKTGPYICIEKMYECPEKGHRLDRWYPIKKQEGE